MSDRIELVKAYSPLILSVTGCISGVVVVILSLATPNVSDTKFNSLINFATAITSIALGGAAGVSQQSPRNQIRNIQNVDELK